MSSKASRAAAYAQDILDAISSIVAFISGMDRRAFGSDLKTRSAVERQLLIAAEAMARLIQVEGDLPEEQRFEVRFPQIPVHKIRGVGNILRHAYDRIDEHIMWEAVTGDDLPDLRSALLSAYPSVRCRDGAAGSDSRM